MPTSKIVDEIVAERDRQKSLVIHLNQTGDDWDKKNSRNDWTAYIATYAGKARNERQGEDFRANMVKVAALAIAAIEAHDKGYC